MAGRTSKTRKRSRGSAMMPPRWGLPRTILLVATAVYLVVLGATMANGGEVLMPTVAFALVYLVTIVVPRVMARKGSRRASAK